MQNSAPNSKKCSKGAQGNRQRPSPEPVSNNRTQSFIRTNAAFFSSVASNTSTSVLVHTVTATSAIFTWLTGAVINI